MKMVTLMLALVLWPQTGSTTVRIPEQDGACYCQNSTSYCNVKGKLVLYHDTCSGPDDTAPTKPEPMDVPAVQTSDHVVGPLHSEPAYIKGFADECVSMGYQYTSAGCHIQRWTCKNKSRIILTAEDGTRHCIRFPKEEK